MGFFSKIYLEEHCVETQHVCTLHMTYGFVACSCHVLVYLCLHKAFCKVLLITLSMLKFHLLGCIIILNPKYFHIIYRATYITVQKIGFQQPFLLYSLSEIKKHETGSKQIQVFTGIKSFWPSILAFYYRLSQSAALYGPVLTKFGTKYPCVKENQFLQIKDQIVYQKEIMIYFDS